MIELFIKVRSFSTAINYVQKHHCLKKGTNKEAVRTEVKRKNDDFHQRNHELQGNKES